MSDCGTQVCGRTTPENKPDLMSNAGVTQGAYIPVLFVGIPATQAGCADFRRWRKLRGLKSHAPPANPYVIAAA